MTNRALTDNFLDYQASARRLSPHTLAAYRRDLDCYLDFLSRNKLFAPQVHSADIRRHLSELRRRGLSATSMQRHLSSLRGFYQYLVRFHTLKSNPAAALSAPKSGGRLPGTLDVDRMQQLLAFDGDSDIDRRDRAIMELFYSSGLRLAELAALDCDDIDFRDGLVQVVGKGNKARRLPVGRLAILALRAWLAVRRAPADENALFLSSRGGRLSHRAIESRLKHRAKQAGVADNLYPHKLRHSFASHLLQSSGDLRAVQELLGHANLSTTQIYTHLDYQHLANVYDGAHPRAQRKNTGENQEE